MQFSFFYLFLLLQSRLTQGQIETIPYACVRTSQLYVVITGVLDIWCEMGMVTFSVCLLAHPSSHHFCPVLPSLPPLSSVDYDRRRTLEGNVKCVWMPAGVQGHGQTSTPTGALCHWNRTSLLMGPSAQEKTMQRARGQWQWNIRLKTMSPLQFR